jgi:hypothetical protein
MADGQHELRTSGLDPAEQGRGSAHAGFDPKGEGGAGSIGLGSSYHSRN